MNHWTVNYLFSVATKEKKLSIIDKLNMPRNNTQQCLGSVHNGFFEISAKKCRFWSVKYTYAVEIV